MRDRWQLVLLPPFIARWSILSSALGLALFIVGSAPNTWASLLLGLSLCTAWAAMTLFLVWLYSMRP